MESIGSKLEWKHLFPISPRGVVTQCPHHCGHTPQICVILLSCLEILLPVLPGCHITNTVQLSQLHENIATQQSACSIAQAHEAGCSHKHLSVSCNKMSRKSKPSKISIRPSMFPNVSPYIDFSSCIHHHHLPAVRTQDYHKGKVFTNA